MINIEYGHIYADKEAGPEQIDTIITAERYIKSQGPDRCVKCVMEDEYHPTERALVLTRYLNFLEAYGMLPDYVVKESDLVPLAYTLLYSIPESGRRKLSRWIQEKELFPCSLLTATWYLVRLGALPPVPMIAVTGGVVPFAGNSLMTILPIRYKENEERAIELISLSQWNHLAKQCDCIFTEG